MWFHKKEQPIKKFDPEELKPMIRSSICTGEKVAGFQELSTGKFREVQLIQTREDLERFLKTYGLKEEDVPIFY